MYLLLHHLSTSLGNPYFLPDTLFAELLSTLYGTAATPKCLFDNMLPGRAFSLCGAVAFLVTAKRAKSACAVSLCISDFDECSLGVNACFNNTMCVDLPRGYLCSCPPGTTGDGRNCSGAYMVYQKLAWCIFLQQFL